MNYEQYAVLHGFEPLKEPIRNGAFFQGGKLAEGKLSTVIKRSVELMDQGYYGLMLMPQSGETYEAAQIREIAARPDFPQ